MNANVDIDGVAFSRPQKGAGGAYTRKRVSSNAGQRGRPATSFAQDLAIDFASTADRKPHTTDSRDGIEVEPASLRPRWVSREDIFAQYADPALQNVEYIRQGFSWPGFLFGSAWLVYKGVHGLATVAIFTLSVAIAVVLLGATLVLGADPLTTGIFLPFVILVLVHWVIGVYANEWRAVMLRERGYNQIQLLTAVNEDHAARIGEAALFGFDEDCEDEIGANSLLYYDGESDEIDRNASDELADSFDKSLEDVDPQLLESEHLRVAQREIQSGRVHKATWARAFATYADDIDAVRCRYISLRAMALETAADVGESSTDDVPTLRINDTDAKPPVIKKRLSAKEKILADQHLEKFVEDHLHIRRLDKPSLDVMSSLLTEFSTLTPAVLSTRLAGLGLRLEDQATRGELRRTGFTEYRVISELGDVLNIPDRFWLRAFIQKLWERGEAMHQAYVSGRSRDTQGTREQGTTRLPSIDSGAREQFLRKMKDEDCGELSVYQRAIDGQDVDVDKLFATESKKPIDPVSVDNHTPDLKSLDWVESQGKAVDGNPSEVDLRINLRRTRSDHGGFASDDGGMRFTGLARTVARRDINDRPSGGGTPFGTRDRDFLAGLVEPEPRNSPNVERTPRHRIGVFVDSGEKI